MSPGPAKKFDPEQALEAAMRVFGKYGYAGASLSVLLDEMGIAKKSLYDTFGNKRQLFLRVLDLYSSQSLVELENALRKPGSPLSNLKAVFLKRNTEPCAECFLGTNMADFEERDEDVSARLCQLLAQTEQIIARTVQAAQQQGEVVAHVQPEQVASLLAYLTQATALGERIGACSEQRAGAISVVFDLLEG